MFYSNKHISRPVKSREELSRAVSCADFDFPVQQAMDLTQQLEERKLERETCRSFSPFRRWVLFGETTAFQLEKHHHLLFLCYTLYPSSLKERTSQSKDSVLSSVAIVCEQKESIGEETKEVRRKQRKGKTTSIIWVFPSSVLLFHDIAVVVEVLSREIVLNSFLLWFCWAINFLVFEHLFITFCSSQEKIEGPQPSLI